MSEFSDIFTKLLEKSSKAQKELAKEIGIDAGHLSDLKSGDRRPSAKVLQSICEVFKLSERETRRLTLAVVRDKGFDI